jgi:hypothetical protein
MFVEGIQVAANGAFEESWFLRYDTEVSTKIMETDVCDIHSVDRDGAVIQLGHSEQ